MPRTRRLRAPAVVAVLLAAVVAAAAAQEAAVPRLACGGYDVVPSGFGAAGQPTRLAIQREGRLLLSLTDWRISSTSCEALGKDRAPELVVRTFSGGAQCCETVHVYALDGNAPRRLLRYEGNNAIGLEVRDLDGDGRRELILGDDTFAYFGDLCYACSPTPLPLVACRADDHFEDCTRQFPDLVRGVLDRYRERLQHRTAGSAFQDAAGDALGVVALSALLGEDDRGLEAVRAAGRDGELVLWVTKALPQVQDWVAARGKKLKDGKQ